MEKANLKTEPVSSTLNRIKSSPLPLTWAQPVGPGVKRWIPHSLRSSSTHSNCRQSGIDARTSFVDLAKHMVDLMPYHYTVGADELCFRLGSDNRIDNFEVPRLTSVISEVRFHDSMIVVSNDANRRVPSQSAPVGVRYVPRRRVQRRQTTCSVPPCTKRGSQMRFSGNT